MTEFVGVKIALLYQNKVIVIRRDNKPGLRFADMWDFPGGARDGRENPRECVIREVREELGINLQPSAIIWKKTYPAMHDARQTAYFMVAKISPEQFQGIEFGDEGQGWKLVSADEFMKDKAVIEPLKGRLNDYLAGSSKPGTKA